MDWTPWKLPNPPAASSIGRVCVKGKAPGKPENRSPAFEDPPFFRALGRRRGWDCWKGPASRPENPPRKTKRSTFQPKSLKGIFTPTKIFDKLYPRGELATKNTSMKRDPTQPGPCSCIQSNLNGLSDSNRCKHITTLR